MAKAAPTGTRTLTAPARDGFNRNRIIINKMGPTAIFGFLVKKTTANPPKRAGKILAKAGANRGDSKMGRSWLKSNIPMNNMSVVTMEETPMAMVEIISPSGVPGSTLENCMALMAQGAFSAVILPVTKLK